MHKQYFEDIEKQTEKILNIARAARKKGLDPTPEPEIKIAKNMSERVVGLVSTVTDKLKFSEIVKRINELEREYGTLDWRVALKISEEIVEEKFCKFETIKEAIEIAVRVGFTYITVGVVAAPLEGLQEVEVKKGHLAVKYSGPIRGAGGTASAVSLILLDHVRKKKNIGKYKPTENEIKRYIAEINDYHTKVTNLQYHPSEEEIRFLINNIPIEISGSPTEKIELNTPEIIGLSQRIRGGMCLVLAEGIAQKAKKVWKRIKEWGVDFDLDWGFIKEFIEIQDYKKSKGHIENKVQPNYSYIKELVAGRPVYSMPMQAGGFRLRYGRSRVSGFSAMSLHPHTIKVLDRTIATGTQIRLERPGKAATITPCDTIEGPIVKLKNGDVTRLTAKVSSNIDQIDKILFLGDILINYGDFYENNHPLVPAGYCEEWHALELERAIVTMFGSMNFERAQEFTGVNKSSIERYIRNPLENTLTLEESLELSKKLNTPLNPLYTHYYKTLSKDDLLYLIEKIGTQKHTEQNTCEIILDKKIKSIFEKAGILHTVEGHTLKHTRPELKATLRLDKFTVDALRTKIKASDKTDALELINEISDMKIKDKGGTFIGARMGRPEKSKMRKIAGSPNVLFPLEAKNHPIYTCQKCKTTTLFHICDECNKKTTPTYYCNDCEKEMTENKCLEHGLINIATAESPIKFLKQSFEKTKEPFAKVKGTKETTNETGAVEHLTKGIFREKFNLTVNKDGTIRYDMTESPMTHFTSEEIRTSIEKLKELGYKHDKDGKELISKKQILELKPQDLILPSATSSTDEKCDDALIRVSKFIDKILQKQYKQKSFYKIKTPEDLAGHLVIGLAPHTSAGIIGRIIGFSDTQVMYAHPFYHAAMRRDCDGDEASIILLLDGFLNFSQKYLPNRIGAKSMDAPLVLTTRIDPKEIDDMAHGIDTVSKYPLKLYEAAEKIRPAYEVKITQVKNNLETDKAFTIGYTHNSKNINATNQCSSYKTLPTMKEKMESQMRLAEKIEAVNESKVAGMIIEKHFLKDILSNLKRFTIQKLRCSCGEKYSRPPLTGTCTKCKGKLRFSVTEGGIKKYLHPSLDLASKYKIDRKLKEKLELLDLQLQAIFG